MCCSCMYGLSVIPAVKSVSNWSACLQHVRLAGSQVRPWLWYKSARHLRAACHTAPSPAFRQVPTTHPAAQGMAADRPQKDRDCTQALSPQAHLRAAAAIAARTTWSSGGHRPLLGSTRALMQVAAASAATLCSPNSRPQVRRYRAR
mmetsp:Transcript_18653/g.55645  ORF Transcript_18653/g.55645 Transcript_18653/m.55645 type:complete len:147 (-) Transcript_18653:886-1326(-)